MRRRRLATAALAALLGLVPVACSDDDPSDQVPVDPQTNQPGEIEEPESNDPDNSPTDTTVDVGAGGGDDADDPGTIGGTTPQPPGAGDETDGNETGDDQDGSG